MNLNEDMGLFRIFVSAALVVVVFLLSVGTVFGYLIYENIVLQNLTQNDIRDRVYQQGTALEDMRNFMNNTEGFILEE